MKSIMQETKDTSLFTELTAEESASVNGGYYYGCYDPCRPRPRCRRRWHCCCPKRRRRHCGYR
jgi:hypothetical protein